MQRRRVEPPIREQSNLTRKLSISLLLLLLSVQFIILTRSESSVGRLLCSILFSSPTRWWVYSYIDRFFSGGNSPEMDVNFNHRTLETASNYFWVYMALVWHGCNGDGRKKKECLWSNRDITGRRGGQPARSEQVDCTSWNNRVQWTVKTELGTAVSEPSPWMDGWDFKLFRGDLCGEGKV